MERRVVPVVGGLLLFGVACNAISGASDLVIAEPGDGGFGIDARGDDGRVVDAATASDGPIDTAVSPTLARCGDRGICMPSVRGWSPVVHVITAFGPGSSCPDGWPVRSEPLASGEGECVCNCAPTNGSCAGAIELKSGPGCTNAAPSPLPTLPADGTCTRASYRVPESISLTPRPMGPPTSCRGSVGDELAPPLTILLCGGPKPTTTSACVDEEICVPRSTPGQLNCIRHDGDVVCPENMPVRRIIGAKIEDLRSCGNSCECAPDQCLSGRIEAFTDTECTTGRVTRNTDGQCKVGITKTVESFRYRAGSGCAVSKRPEVVGSEKVEAPQTICCAIF